MCCSQDLGFFVKETHELGNGGSVGADDPAGIFCGRFAQRNGVHPDLRGGCRLFLDGLVFRSHDSLERGVPRVVQSLLGKEYRGELRADDLVPPFDFPLAEDFPPFPYFPSSRRRPRTAAREGQRQAFPPAHRRSQWIACRKEQHRGQDPLFLRQVHLRSQTSRAPSRPAGGRPGPPPSRAPCAASHGSRRCRD